MLRFHTLADEYSYTKLWTKMHRAIKILGLSNDSMISEHLSLQQVAASFSQIDVETAMRDFRTLNSLRPYGIGAKFLTGCWDIVKQEVYNQTSRINHVLLLRRS